MDILQELQRRESIIRRFRELEAKPIYIRMMEMEAANLRARALMEQRPITNYKSVAEVFAERELMMRRIDEFNRLSCAEYIRAYEASQISKTSSSQI